MHPSHFANIDFSTAIRFPFAAPPEPGKVVEVAAGVYWLSTCLPYRLRSINLWLLRDGNCWTMIDSGFPLPEVRQQIEITWNSLLDGRPITRLVISHHHPDHVGNCRWICERWGIIPSFTAREWRQSEELMSRGWQERAPERIDFFCRHGLSKDEAIGVDKSLCQHRALFTPPPDKFQPLNDGDLLRIGDTEWKILVVSGHSPAQAVLYSRERGLLISGDQVLPQITPNVSVRFNDGDEQEPLVRFLESIRRVAENCADPLVLPSHKLPFIGLQPRIKTIEHHHEERLQLVERELKLGPRTAASLIPVLFGDPQRLTGHEMHFALGESIAHLHHLVSLGRVAFEDMKGQIIFRRG